MKDEYKQLKGQVYLQYLNNVNFIIACKWPQLLDMQIGNTVIVVTCAQFASIG